MNKKIIERIVNFLSFIRLSDKILMIIFLFSTVLLALAKFFIGGSVMQLLIFSYFLYSIAFVVTYLISANFSKRVVEMSFRIQEMAAGNLSKKLVASSRDELGQLTNALNELTNRLATGIAIDVSKNQEIDKAKSDFVSLAAHQLRTPLSIIKWYMDFVIGGDAGAITDEQKKYLMEVYRSNERLIDLVNALLDVSRIDLGTFAIEPESVDLIKIAEGAIEAIDKEAKEKNLRLEKFFDDIPHINLDPRLMRIVFLNILSNAVKYTADKGTVRIEIKRTGDKVLIKIADNGVGIPREQQPRIFSKLFRADNAKKMEAVGTGCGLYIVKAVIEQSGGKIWYESPNMDLMLDRESRTGHTAESTDKKGTTFYISIPMEGMKPKKGTKKLSSVS